MDLSVLLLIVAVLVGVAVVVGVLSPRRESVEARRPLLPRLVAAACLVGVAVVALGTVIGVAQSLIPTSWVTLEIPVTLTVEETPTDLRADPSGSLTDAVVAAPTALTVDGLGTAARIWLAMGTLIEGAVAVTLLLVVARFARQSISDTPFTPRLGRLLVIAGITLAIGGIAGQIASGISGLLAHEQLFALSPDALGDGLPVPPALTFDLWPLGVGLALVVVAGLVRSGERLQRETAGLV